MPWWMSTVALSRRAESSTLPTLPTLPTSATLPNMICLCLACA